VLLGNRHGVGVWPVRRQAARLSPTELSAGAADRPLSASSAGVAVSTQEISRPFGSDTRAKRRSPRFISPAGSLRSRSASLLDATKFAPEYGFKPLMRMRFLPKLRAI
jgi:hypothetical protein